MKICMISESSSYHTRRWVQGLVNLGHDVHVVSPVDSPVEGADFTHAPLFDPNPVLQLRNAYRVRALITRLQSDIVHLFGLFSVNSLLSMLAVGRWPNLVTSVWGSDIVYPARAVRIGERGARAYLLARSHLVFAASEYLAAETRVHCPPHVPVEVIPWGVDTAVFVPGPVQGKTGARIVLGFAKRLHGLSGPDMAIEVLRATHRASPVSFLLRMAGTGPMEDSVRSLVAEYGLQEHVEWAGWLRTDEELASFYRSLDIYLAPSRQEAFGLSAVEACACGVPVVAFRTGGLPEVVTDGENGLLVRPDDCNAMAQAVLSLADDPERRAGMGVAARRIVETRLDWHETLRKTYDRYRSLISKEM